MTHWLISNNPLLKFAPLPLVTILVAVCYITNEGFATYCIIFSSIFLIIIFFFPFVIIDGINGSMKKLIIEEYILLQPLKEVDEAKQEEMWQEITLKVNSAARKGGLKDYVYKEGNVKRLLHTAIEEFKIKFYNYKKIDAESIVGSDRVLFIATEMYDEVVDRNYEKKFSSAVWKDYANKKLGSIVKKTQDGSSYYSFHQTVPDRKGN